MLYLKGIPIYGGVVIGKVIVSDSIFDLEIPKYGISLNDVEGQIEKLKDAMSKVFAQITLEKERHVNSVSETLEILELQLAILQDSELTSRTVLKIRNQLCNVEHALNEALKDMSNMFSTESEYLDRIADIKDVVYMVLKTLLNQNPTVESDNGDKFIYAAKDLFVSDLIKIDKNKIAGILLEFGGVNSHVAILSRAFGIPSIFGIDLHGIKNGDQIIMDATSGNVITNCDDKILDEYRKKIESLKSKKSVDKSKHENCTFDGFKVDLDCNIEVFEELEMVKASGASGIGLFRSEFSFLQNSFFPCEETQFEYYSKMLKESSPMRFVIRTLDIGGDKTNEEVESILKAEKNPILGLRGIRFFLKNPKILKDQFRAILRASVFGNLNVMFPMISSLEQFLEAKKLFLESKEDLLKEGYEVKDNIPLGITIEVPSAVLCADALARHCDFFSIGTNDLIQYLLAVDRDNSNVSEYYDQFHPSVLKSIKLTLDAANRYGIWTSICGEAASDPRLLPFFIGIGYSNLSMNIAYIPRIRYFLNRLTLKESREIANIILSLDSGSEILKFIKENIEEKYKGVFS